MIWFQLALFAVSFLLTALFAPRPNIENARPSGLDDLQVPQAGEGAPLALVLGKVRLRGPNTIWYGDFQTLPIKERVSTGLFSSKNVTMGYEYKLGFQLGLCLGPDTHLRRIWADKDELWAGDASGDGAVIDIDKPSLFGGHKEGGGFTGRARFYSGDFTQSQNAYLLSHLDQGVPAYNGIAHIVFEGCNIGESAMLRPLSFELERYPNPLGLDPSVNLVGEDLNPATALYYLLNEGWGGLGVDFTSINFQSFADAAPILANEGNGMSLLISKANSGKNAIEEVLRQIDGLLYQDPSTGEIMLALVREDYELDELPVFGPSEITQVRSFSRTAWEDTFNQVRVNFTNRANKYENGTAMVQDMANINSQGRVRSTSVSFPSCHEGELAVELGTRELTQLSIPMFQATLELNRKAGSLRPGDPFIFRWPDFGIEQVVMRVQRFVLGELIDGRIVIEAVQDEFATQATVFAAPDNSLFEPIDRSAVPITEALALELPYFYASQQEVVDFPPAANEGYLMVLPRQPNGFQQGFSATVGDSTPISRESYANTAILDEDLTQYQGFAGAHLSFLTIRQPSLGSDFLENHSTTEIRQGFNWFIIGGELFCYESVTDNGDGTWTLSSVYRSLLDTYFEAHAEGDAVYFLSVDGILEDVYSGTGSYDILLQSFTDRDETPLAEADSYPVTLNRRLERPLRPGRVQIGGNRTPGMSVDGTAPFTVVWSHRSRLENPIRFEADVSDATLEPGTTYTVRLMVGGVENTSETGVTLNNAQLTPVGSPTGPATIEIEVVRDGLTSYSKTILPITLT